MELSESNALEKVKKLLFAYNYETGHNFLVSQAIFPNIFSQCPKLNKECHAYFKSAEFYFYQSLIRTKSWPKFVVLLSFLTSSTASSSHIKLGCQEFHLKLFPSGKLNIIPLKWHPARSWCIFSH